MAFFVAAYDLRKTMPDPYSAFIECAERWGWSSLIPMRDGRTGKLPNTTLVGTFANMEAAVVLLEKARLDACGQIMG